MSVYVIAAAAVLAAIAAADIVIETRIFITRRYEMQSSKINSKKTHKIAVLSDLHNNAYGKGNKKLIDAINREEPDIIVVAGDLLVAKPGRDFSVPLALLENLSARYPVYYGLGNHEYRLRIYPEKYGTMYEEYMGKVRALGIHVLENECETVLLGTDQVDICGLEIEMQYYRRFRDEPMEEGYIEGLIGKKGSHYTMLIAHNPSYFKEYSDWGADLTFSGHVHGGIVRIPFIGGVASPQIKLFPKYDGGVFAMNGHEMILSRGLGTHTINIRMNNPAELVLVTLKGQGHGGI